jgi:glyoxylase-like metal-dependent hydrolase (beta-lactamase superfamily II)
MMTPITSDSHPSIVQIIAENGFFCNSYLIRSQSGLCLIDPAHSIKKVPGAAEVTRIIATHGHYDHIAHLREWHRGETGFAIHEAERNFLSQPGYNLSNLFGLAVKYRDADTWLSDGSQIDLDETLTLTVYHTPGHTPGSCCLLLTANDEPLVFFTGDTLFRDSIGRTDFPGGSNRKMQASLKALQKLFAEWPDDLPLLPGHGPATTVGREQKYNSWLINP